MAGIVHSFTQLCAKVVVRDGHSSRKATVLEIFWPSRLDAKFYDVKRSQSKLSCIIDGFASDHQT